MYTQSRSRSKFSHGACVHRRSAPLDRHKSQCCGSATLHMGIRLLKGCYEPRPARGFDVFRWEKRKKGYVFLSYHRHVPARHCLTYMCSGLRELAMPAQKTRSHGSISLPILIASIGRFHQWRWYIVVQIIGGHYHRYI